MDQEFLESLGLEPEVMEAIRDRWQQETQSYEGRLRQQQVDHAISGAVSAAGGRNVTAIRALLDEDAIAASEDLTGAAKAAVRRLKREHGYLFSQARTVSPGTGTARVMGDYSMEELSNLSMADYRRLRRGQ